jgi:hypothetical protein
MSQFEVTIGGGSPATAREGVNLRTKEQQVSLQIFRLRPNSSDILIYNGREVNDDFFDDNLLDPDVSGAITSAPSPYAEQRSLGMGSAGRPVFDDIGDFDAVAYLLDAGLAMYPVILTAAGYADPSVSDGAIGAFETRPEAAGLIWLPAFAKRGIKGSACFAAEATDHRSYLIQQARPRNGSYCPSYSSFIEVSTDDLIDLLPSYADQIPEEVHPFIDSSDTKEASVWGAEDTPNQQAASADPEISSILANGLAGAYLIDRNEISAGAGWTFLNVINGTDSIVYSDRM